MRWSIPVASIKGTVVRIHATFLLFVLWIGMAAGISHGPAAALVNIGFVLLLFGCVVAHEFGHILMARHFGVRTPEVILLPIGGILRLERIPEKPGEELLIALAGPAVSVAIGVALVALPGRLAVSVELGGLGFETSLLAALGAANLALAAFNLLPAFPMDGGRLLRALLAMRIGRSRATRIAAGAGEALALLLGVAALIAGHPILLLIALFIYVAAATESGVSMMRDAIGTLTAEEVMIVDFAPLAPDTPISGAADALIWTSQDAFPVVREDGAVAGVINRTEILAALRDTSDQVVIGSLPLRPLPCVARTANAVAALDPLESGAPMVGVTDAGGRLVGMVTWENLSEQMMIAEARRRFRGRAAAKGGRLVAQP